MEQERRERKSDWLTANVLLGLLIFLVVQFGTVIWWASSITAELRFLSQTINERTQDVYTKTEAGKDFATRDSAISSTVKRLERLEDRKRGD